MCYLGNKFNLNASESAGFFQGIGTIISIIVGFLLIKYKAKQKEQETIEELKQAVIEFKLYIEHILPDPIAEIEREDSFLKKEGISLPDQIAFALQLTCLDNILSEKNKETLEEQYYIARRSLIKLKLTKDLEILSTTKNILTITFAEGEKISEAIKNDATKITPEQKSELNKSIKSIDIYIKSLKKIISQISIIKH